MDTDQKSPFKPFRLGIWLMLIALVLLLAIYVFRGFLIAPYATTFLERAVADNLGLQVTIGELSGSYFSNVQIKDVKTVKRNAEGPLTDLELRDVKLTYHLLSLFKGLPAFLSEISIYVDGGLIAIDLTNLRDSDQGEEKWPDFPLPQRLPRIQIKKSSIQLKGIGYETSFEDIALTADNEGSTATHVNLNISEWQFKQPSLKDIAANVDADIVYSDSQFTLAKLIVGKQSLVKLITIDLGELPALIPFQAVVNPAGGHIEVSGELSTDQLAMQLLGADIDLTQISELLAADVPQFGGIFSVKGKLALPLNEPTKMQTDLDIEIAGGLLNGKEAERLNLTFTSSNGNLEIKDLKLLNDSNQLSINKASVPAKVAFEGDGVTLLQSLMVDWQLVGSNIPSLLKLFGLTFIDHGEQIPAHTLRLGGRMEKGDILIPRGSLETENGHIHLNTAQITLPIGVRALADSPLAADLLVDLPKIGILSQIFTLPRLEGSMKGQIQIAGTLKAPIGTATLKCDELTYQNIALGNLSILAKADEQRMMVKSFAVERGKDRANGRGTINWKKTSFEDVFVEVDVRKFEPYFKDIVPMFWQSSILPNQVQGQLKGTLKLSGAFKAPEGHLDLQARQIKINGSSFGDADVDLMLSEKQVKVSSAVFRHLNDRLQIRGALQHESRKLNDVDILVEISDLAAYASPWLQPDTIVSGSLKGELQASGDLFSPTAEANLQVAQLRLDSNQIASGYAKLKSVNRLITIDSAEIKTGEGTLQMAGQIHRNVDDTEFKVKIENAAFVRQSTLLALEQPANLLFFRNGRIVFSDLDLAGSAGKVSINGNFDPHGKSDLLIAMSDLRSDGWIDMILTDRVQFKGLNARAKISGRFEAPVFEADGSVDNLGRSDIPMVFSGKFNVAYKNRNLKIDKFELFEQKGQQIYLNGNLPVDIFGSNLLAPGQIALSGRTNITDASVLAFALPWVKDTSGAIQCDFKLAGTWMRPDGELNLNIKDLKRPGAIKPLPPGPYNITGGIQIKGDLISLKSLEAYSSSWKLGAQGQWSGAPSPADLFRNKKPKLSGQVKLESSLTVSDMQWLAQEISGLRRISGRLEANGTLNGPITSPAANATIRLSDTELSPDFDMPPLRKMNMETTVTPETITVQKLNGEVGGAPFDLAGTFKILKGASSETDFKFRGENILLYRNENLRVRADTDLTLRGPTTNMELAGEVSVTDGGFFKSFGVIEGFGAIGKPKTGGGLQLFSIQEAPLNNMRFNVRITAEEPFVVRNNLVKGSVRPDLMLTGTGELPLLIGRVYVEPTRLYLPAGRMNLKAGLVRFEQTAPDRPNLDLIGTTTMRGYDITAVIDGPYDEPVITLSSVPPLPNEELLMLLLTGQPPKSSGGRASGTKQGLNVAMFLGRDLVSRLSGNDSDEELESMIDRFDVEVGRGITQRGEETIHSQFRLKNNVLVDGDSLYLTGERDYFDYYNGGVKLVFRFR